MKLNIKIFLHIFQQQNIIYNMITNFKLFENTKDTACWKINTNPPYFKISLKKIGMDSVNINYWLTLFDNYFNKTSYIIIHKDFDENGKIIWSWTSYSDNLYNFTSPLTQDMQVINYMGEIPVEEHEIDAEKYNL